MLKFVVVACLLCAVSVPPVLAFADADAIQPLSVAEMEQVVGGQDPHPIPGSPVMVPASLCEDKPEQGWSHECSAGSDSECMLYEETWCIHKIGRLGYQECVDASLWNWCVEMLNHCYLAEKYDPVAGTCNNGDPNQQCQGAYRGTIEVGDTKWACDAGWISM